MSNVAHRKIIISDRSSKSREHLAKTAKTALDKISGKTRAAQILFLAYDNTEASASTLMENAGVGIADLTVLNLRYIDSEKNDPVWHLGEIQNQLGITKKGASRYYVLVIDSATRALHIDLSRRNIQDYVRKLHAFERILDIRETIIASTKNTDLNQLLDADTETYGEPPKQFTPFHDLGIDWSTINDYVVDNKKVNEKILHEAKKLRGERSETEVSPDMFEFMLRILGEDANRIAERLYYIADTLLWDPATLQNALSKDIPVSLVIDALDRSRKAIQDLDITHLASDIERGYLA